MWSGMILPRLPPAPRLRSFHVSRMPGCAGPLSDQHPDSGNRALLSPGISPVTHGLETLKEGDPLLQRTQNCLVSTNRASLEAAAQEARSRGYQPLILSASMQGSAADLARFYVSMVSEVLATGHPLPAPCCLLSGAKRLSKSRAVEKGDAIRSSPSGVSMRRGPGRVHQRSSPPLGRTDPMVRRRRPEPSCRQPRGLGPRSWGWIPGTTCNETTPTTSSSSSTT